MDNPATHLVCVAENLLEASEKNQKNLTALRENIKLAEAILAEAKSIVEGLINLLKEDSLT